MDGVRFKEVQGRRKWGGGRGRVTPTTPGPAQVRLLGSEEGNETKLYGALIVAINALT